MDESELEHAQDSIEHAFRHLEKGNLDRAKFFMSAAQARALLSIAASLEKLAGCVTFESPTSSWLQVMGLKDMGR